MEARRSAHPEAAGSNPVLPSTAAWTTAASFLCIRLLVLKDSPPSTFTLDGGTICSIGAMVAHQPSKLIAPVRPRYAAPAAQRDGAAIRCSEAMENL